MWRIEMMNDNKKKGLSDSLYWGGWIKFGLPISEFRNGSEHIYIKKTYSFHVAWRINNAAGPLWTPWFICSFSAKIHNFNPCYLTTNQSYTR